MGKSSAHRLDDGFLGRECIARNRSGRRVRSNCSRSAGSSRRSSRCAPEARIAVLHAPRLQHVASDPEDHLRGAASINAFIARTAWEKPSNIACATIACPMLSSTTSRMAAIGATFVIVHAVPGVHGQVRDRQRSAPLIAQSLQLARLRLAPLVSA